MGGIAPAYSFSCTTCQIEILKTKPKNCLFLMKLLEIKCIKNIPWNEKNKNEVAGVEIL